MVNKLHACGIECFPPALSSSNFVMSQKIVEAVNFCKSCGVNEKSQNLLNLQLKLKIVNFIKICSCIQS